MNNENYIKMLNKKINEIFEKNSYDLFQKNVIDAMEYSLKAGGKRVRATLIYEFCKMCNGNIEKATAPAAAMEMIHTYSLIHDDLPSMDNDDFRRGRPSCHKAFNEYTAILAGDALNTLAFQIIAEDNELSDEVKVKLIYELSKSAGVFGMIGGQQMDLEFENKKDITLEELLIMCVSKTGALIQCSCKLGAITARAPQYLIDKASDYGMCLGLVFQIIDDILDVEGDQDLIGKPLKSDIEENKSTFVSILGIDEAKKKAEYYTDKALQILDSFPDNENLKEYTKELLNRQF